MYSCASATSIEQFAFAQLNSVFSMLLNYKLLQALRGSLIISIVVITDYCSNGGPASVPANSVPPSTFNTTVGATSGYTCANGYQADVIGPPVATCTALNASAGQWTVNSGNCQSTQCNSYLILFKVLVKLYIVWELYIVYELTESNCKQVIFKQLWISNT